MRKKVYYPTIISVMCMLFLLEVTYAQRFDFSPNNPAKKFWQGETYYTETPKFSLDFELDTKKIDAITVLNETVEREVLLFKEGDRFVGDIFLREGANDISVWATKKKGKFQQNIRVFFNPYKSSVSYNQGNCQIKPYGTYNLTPEVGSEDIVISRYSKSNFEVHFMVGCCDDDALNVIVENPKGQPVTTRKIAPNIFSFNATLFDYQNPFMIRAKCKGENIAQGKIVVKVDQEIENRLDTAIIFAISNHNKQARRLGWADLRYSQEDAEALKWTLENKYGFHVQIIADPTWEQMNESMQSLITKRWNKLDQLFIFFTGHGYKAPDGSGYLVPSNVGKSLKTLYKMEDLRSQIDQVGCNNISLNIDACFASTFLERGGADIPTRKGLDIHHLLSSDLPFRYFIGSAPSNRKAEEGVVNKDAKEADGKYRYKGKKFKVSEFMMSFLEALEMGDDEFSGGPIPIWYVGRKVEEIYRPKKQIEGVHVYARTSRFGSQNDKGFHFINKKILLQ